MDSKQLLKVIKVLVEAEVAKKQEQFLSKTFPKILEEEVTRRVKSLLEVKGGVVAASAKSVEIDPFVKTEALLRKERNSKSEIKTFTKNPVINEILNQTKPFSKEQRAGGTQVKSVLDTFQQQPIQEAASYVPSYMDAEPDIDETITFNNPVTAQVGLGAMRNQMAAKMGYGDMGGSTPNRGGLGVTTGLPGLDRILNRDNSELVKRFKK